MVKMAASLLLILGGAGIGYARSREITEREKNLEILLQILFFLKGEIRCGNSSLPDASVSYTHLTLPTTPYV